MGGVPGGLLGIIDLHLYDQTGRQLLIVNLLGSLRGKEGINAILALKAP
jgi:hypothetical protein